MAGDGRTPSSALDLAGHGEVTTTANEREALETSAQRPPDPAAPRPALGAVPAPGAGAHDFYQALRRLECAFRDHPRLGEAIHVAEEPVRFGQEPSLAFEPAMVSEAPAGDGEGPPRIQVTFGTLGPNGPLPLHLTEYARQRLRNARDTTFSRFLDVFHHRLVTLFYRAWANAQPTVHRDRPKHDRFASYVGATIGLEPRREGPEAVADVLRIYMARHLACHARHPEGLCKLVGALLGVPVALEEFVGEWLEVPDTYCWRLGARSPAGGIRLGQLGTSTRVGRRVWERQHKFRLALGPLDRNQYQRLLPGGEDLARLRELVIQYIGHELAWDIRLVLLEEAVRPTLLGQNGRLGRTTYLVQHRAQPTKTWQDLIVDPASPASRTPGPS